MHHHYASFTIISLLINENLMCEGILSLIRRMDTSFRDIYKLNIKTKNSFPNTSVLCLTPYTIWQFLKSASIFWYCWTETNALRAQKNCSKGNLRPRKTSSHTKMMATLNAHQPIEFIAAVPLHSLPSFLSLSQLKHILCLKSGDWLSFCSLRLNKIQQQREKRTMAHWWRYFIHVSNFLFARKNN